MSTSYAGLRKLVVTVPIAALCLLVWVAKSTVAQAPAKAPAPVPIAENAAVPQSPTDAPPPLEQTLTPAADSDSSPPPPPLQDLKPAKQSPPFANQSPSAEPPDAAEDPEKAATVFVEQNEKHAEAQLKALRDEEAKLRDRLRKVEGGIKRWESLLGALKQSRAAGAVTVTGVLGNVSVPPEIGGEPTDLEPVPHPKVLPAKP